MSIVTFHNPVAWHVVTLTLELSRKMYPIWHVTLTSVLYIWFSLLSSEKGRCENGGHVLAKMNIMDTLKTNQILIYTDWITQVLKSCPLYTAVINKSVKGMQRHDQHFLILIYGADMYIEGPPLLRSYTPAAIVHMTVNHAYKYHLFYYSSTFYSCTNW